MENTSMPIENNRGKVVLVIIMALAFVLVILFWVAIQLFHPKDLPLYFMQLGIYLILYLLAWWGLKQEKITLTVDARLILEALLWSLIGWFLFVLLIQLIGLAWLPEEFQALKNISAWKIGANILSTWFFVGMGEELLFRGYILKSFLRHFTTGIDQRRMIVAVLLVSTFFSLWHLSNRIIWLVSGEINMVLFLVSLLTVFLVGIGYAYLFVRSNNILLVGLVHGLMDYPLIGKSTQMTPTILLVAIVCVEITRLITRKKVEAIRQ